MNRSPHHPVDRDGLDGWAARRCLATHATLT
jgi:hypothetical protein